MTMVCFMTTIVTLGPSSVVAQAMLTASKRVRMAKVCWTLGMHALNYDDTRSEKDGTVWEDPVVGLSNQPSGRTHHAVAYGTHAMVISQNGSAPTLPELIQAAAVSGLPLMACMQMRRLATSLVGVLLGQNRSMTLPFTSMTLVGHSPASHI
jgi:hypothetical protein